MEDEKDWSSAWRCQKELRHIYDGLYNELQRYFNDDGTKIVDFRFFARYLSLVRNQGETGSCSFVHAIACTEMVYRMCSGEICDLRDRSYFDIQDCFDHLYKKFSDLPNARKKLLETMGRGTRVPYILKYIREVGLLTHTACTNPQERNLEPIFTETPNRKKLDWFEKIEEVEVFQHLRMYPLIAVICPYKSFTRCRKVEYNGPDIEENANQCGLLRSSHSVLLVGSFSMRTENGERQYVIAQNSYGTDYAFKGFVVIPFDVPNLFLEFWLPILSPKMDCFKKHKRHPQMIGSKKKESTSAT